MQQSMASPFKNPPSSALKQNQRREASGKIIRSILLKDNRQNQPSSVRSDQQNQTVNLERDKRPPRPPSVQLLQKDANVASDDKVPNDIHNIHSEKQEKRTRNKDRPDRVVWTPLRRSDGSHTSDESLSSSASQSAVDATEGIVIFRINMLRCSNLILLNLGGNFWILLSGLGTNFQVYLG